MKPCRLCSSVKAVEDYYLNSGKPMHICKECHKTVVRARRLTNPAVQEYDRKRAKSPHRKALNRQVSAAWRERHPDAYRAQTAVGNALRDGRIARGLCSFCGTDQNVHGHHRDYSRPLDVTWLCAKCHHRIHALFPETAGHKEPAA